MCNTCKKYMLMSPYLSNNRHYHQYIFPVARFVLFPNKQGSFFSLIACSVPIIMSYVDTKVSMKYINTTLS